MSYGVKRKNPVVDAMEEIKRKKITCKETEELSSREEHEVNE